MFEYKTVRWSLQAAAASGEKTIGVVTLARPEALNAIDVRMRIELDLLLDQIRRDDSIRVVIVTGEGRGFSAGGDLRTEAGPLGALDDDHDFGAFGAYRELANYFFNDLRHVVIQRAIRKLETLQAVTIAAINGPAVGIGLELATACDMRYASDLARLGEVAVAARAESGGARNLPKLVGMGRAMEMILSGEIIDAAEAQQIGLVERVFPHDKLLEEVFKIAVQDRGGAVPLGAAGEGAGAALLGSQSQRGGRARRTRCGDGDHAHPGLPRRHPTPFLTSGRPPIAARVTAADVSHERCRDCTGPRTHRLGCHGASCYGKHKAIPAEFRAGSRTTPVRPHPLPLHSNCGVADMSTYNILILGASYGSLLASKLMFGGHK